MEAEKIKILMALLDEHAARDKEQRKKFAEQSRIIDEKIERAEKCLKQNSVKQSEQSNKGSFSANDGDHFEGQVISTGKDIAENNFSLSANESGCEMVNLAIRPEVTRQNTPLLPPVAHQSQKGRNLEVTDLKSTRSLESKTSHLFILKYYRFSYLVGLSYWVCCQCFHSN